MRKIACNEISTAVEKLCAEAAFNLPCDVYIALKEAAVREDGDLSRSLISQCIENADIAAKNRVPICQDTGFAVVFVQQGENLTVEGEDNLFEAIQKGISLGYEKHYLRKSIVNDPLFERKNTGDNCPAIIHLDIVEGDGLKIILAPKGGGSENCSALKMLKPSDGEQGVIDFVVNTVVSAGGNPCPPVIVGVGIGGTAEKCMEIAKRALLRPIVGAYCIRPNNGDTNNGDNNLGVCNTPLQNKYKNLEQKILEKINESGVGAQGLGGKTTALAVHIETHPTHIACLPVAVAINCHVARHSEVVL